MDVVDQRSQRCDAKTTCHEQDVVPLHVLEREGMAIRAAQPHDIAALHVMERARDITRTTHADLDEAALRRRR